MNVKFKIRLTKSQKQAYNLVHTTGKKYFVFNWSRQSGKSTLMKVLCVEWLINAQRQIGYVCKNYILAKRLYKDVLQAFPPEFVTAANGTDLIIQSQFGSTLQFFSAESGSSLRGLTFTHLIMDEFAFFPFVQPDGTHLWYDILSPTVKVKGRKVIFVSTPLGKNNLFYELYQLPFQKGAKSDWRRKWVSLTKTIWDDGLVSFKTIMEIKSQVPELTFKQEYMCEFLDSSLTFFQGFEKCFHNISKRYERTWIGVDLSANGQDDTIVAKMNEKGEVELFEISGTLDMKYAQVAKIINESVNLQGVYLEENGLGAPMINEIRKLLEKKGSLHTWQTTNSSKEDIISELAVKIVKQEITFDKNDSKIYDQLSTFITKTSKSGILQFEAQAGHNDDMVMATAICLRCKQDYKYDKNVYFNKKTNSFKII